MPDFLIKAAEENRTILCFGVDPDISRISKKLGGNKIEETIGPYFHTVIDKLLDEHAIAAIKPNYAFFAQYGFHGLYVLEELIQHYREKIPVILDAKRGDIGKTSKAYAREVFDFWGAQAVTLSPYMGKDSIEPFLGEGKLPYILCRTSNPSSADFQELECNKKPVYEYVAEKALEWGRCGLVVGATSDAIKRIVKITKGKVPLLIPGIGAQGGDLDMVMNVIKDNVKIHRINASSSIAYAFEKHEGTPAEAALKEAQMLNETIRKYF